jgi:hypothetical protein
MTRPDAVPTSSDYRLAPAFGARLVGLLVVGLAVLVFVATGVVAVLDLHTLVLVPVALLGVAAILGVGSWLRRTPVVHLDEGGYRVRLVRGAGVKDAAWREVEDVVATSPRDIPCVVIRLRDGRSTTIPVQALDADRDDFARDLRSYLRRGTGRQPAGGA